MEGYLYTGPYCIVLVNLVISINLPFMGFTIIIKENVILRLLFLIFFDVHVLKCQVY